MLILYFICHCLHLSLYQLLTRPRLNHSKSKYPSEPVQQPIPILGLTRQLLITFLVFKKSQNDVAYHLV